MVHEEIEEEEDLSLIFHALKGMRLERVKV
jgi:hypothetical protein